MADREGAYRQDLEAAHARIAQLEGELAGPPPSPANKKIRELERVRATLLDAIEPKRVRRDALTMLAFMIGLFGLIGGVLAIVQPSIALVAIPIAGLLFGLLMGAGQMFVRPKRLRGLIATIDQQLDEARRMAALEEKKVRVGTSESIESTEEEEEQPHAAERQSQR